MSSTSTHLYLATYGAGLKPGCRLRISNSSSVTLKETLTGDWFSPATQNIFPPMQKHKSLPHLMSSVTWGSALQIS